MAAAHPPLRALPWTEFRRAAESVLRKTGRDLLRPGPPEGSPALKSWLAQFLTGQGVPARPEEILITNGCQQGLDLIAKALLAPGQAVALENPVYPGAWAPMRQAGATLLPVPVGEDAMDLPALEALLERQRVRLLIVSPNFQNPTGATMPLEARRRVLELARTWQVPVVENDSYGLLRCAGPALPSLRSVDGAGQTLYVGSFSKIGFPGLRLGWCLAAPDVIARLRRVKQATDLHTDGFVQAVMEEFARRGGVERAVTAVRRVCAENLETLAAGVQAHFPAQVRWRRPQGGMAAWFTMPAGFDAGSVLKRCLERHVVFTPGKFFYFHGPQANTFRLSFAALDRASLSRGVEILGDALRAECRQARRNEASAPVAGGGWALV
jgi:DNA-binding transcriptional MocR family regulator